MPSHNRDHPLSAWVIERIPQTVRLRSGLRVPIRHHSDAVSFWETFTSSEYLALVHDLHEIDLDGGVIVDCGAGIGMFSVLTEHLTRVGLLPWRDLSWEIIEAASYHYPKLEKTLRMNLPEGRYRIHHAAVGARSGHVTFHEAPDNPWSGSINQREGLKLRKVERSLIDLDEVIAGRKALVKVDVEGAEFSLVETYADGFETVQALIIEWHNEMGDVARSEAQLREAGFRFVRRSHENGNRLVDLYRRS